jgi:uncharacterized protein
VTGVKSAAGWIKSLRLELHPEGGYYREVYRAAESVAARDLPPRFGGRRPFSTSIYFLLKSGEVSRFHRLKSDEVWHFYAGGPVRLSMISPDGVLTAVHLGRNPAEGTRLQAVVPSGFWFGAELVRRRSYALVGCTLAPGFDFDDFELGLRADLLGLYPRYKKVILRLT